MPLLWASSSRSRTLPVGIDLVAILEHVIKVTFAPSTSWLCYYTIAANGGLLLPVLYLASSRLL